MKLRANNDAADEGLSEDLSAVSMPQNLIPDYTSPDHVPAPAFFLPRSRLV
ncbi:MAG: hypothetical protein HOQ05_03070 [Corynebacteriales bacterium]|nr:hypothetical protein [Mycobacteriales bacterium]